VTSFNPFRIVVCASGGGGNLRAVLRGASNGDYRVTRVLVDRPCGAIEVAKEFGVSCLLVSVHGSTGHAIDLLDAIPKGTDLVVLAGFMPIIPPSVLDHWQGKIINTHPSLLPAFGGLGMYGVKVHEAVIAAGEAETGCSIHLVEESVDTGPIIAQERLTVIPGESAWELGGRVFDREGPLLVQTIIGISTGDITLGT